MTDAPTPETTSIWDDFIDIWTSPTALFTRRTDGEWGHAMISLRRARCHPLLWHPGRHRPDL